MEYYNLTPICQVLPVNSTGANDTDAANILRVLTGEEATFDLGGSTQVSGAPGRYVPAATVELDLGTAVLAYAVNIADADQTLVMMEIPHSSGNYVLDQLDSIGNHWYGLPVPNDPTITEILLETPDDEHHYYYLWDANGDGLADEVPWDGSTVEIYIPLGVSLIYEDNSQGKAYLIYSGLLQDGSIGTTVQLHIIESSGQFTVASDVYHYPLEAGAPSSVTCFNTDLIAIANIQYVEV